MNVQDVDERLDQIALVAERLSAVADKLERTAAVLATAAMNIEKANQPITDGPNSSLADKKQLNKPDPIYAWHDSAKKLAPRDEETFVVRLKTGETAFASFLRYDEFRPQNVFNVVAYGEQRESVTHFRLVRPEELAAGFPIDT